MTSAEAPQRLFIPQAFASKTGAALTGIEAAASNNVNFEDGFPSAYEAPSANNGKFVTRGEMNAIGNLASANEYARACGGIVTFDPRLAVKIGGYPRGAVLEMLEGITYNRVISLVDDNMVDFTGSIQNARGASNYSSGVAYSQGTYIKYTVGGVETYYVVTIAITADENTSISNISGKIASLSGVVSGSVDGVNWAYLGNGQIDDGSLIAKVDDFNSSGETYLFGSQIAVEIFPITTFIAQRDGVIDITGGCTVSSLYESTGENDSMGFVIACTEGTVGPKVSGGTQEILYKRGAATYSIMLGDIKVKSVTKGQRYNLWIINAGLNVSNSTIEIRLK